jgi:hypothetical protein
MALESGVPSFEYQECMDIEGSEPLTSGPACFVAASLASIDATPASVAPCNHVPGIPEPGIDSSALTLSAVLKERSGESGHGCRGVTAHIGELRLAELI